MTLCQKQIVEPAVSHAHALYSDRVTEDVTSPLNKNLEVFLTNLAAQPSLLRVFFLIKIHITKVSLQIEAIKQTMITTLY